MAFDNTLAERVRRQLHKQTGVQEKKMFGGLAFMVNGHMCCGIVGNELMVRVGPEQHTEALSQPHARPMDFTGKPMKGMVYVDAAGIAKDAALRAWVERGLHFVRALPPKQ
jgi:TfoX/Sxy family transcriptional regulator of competence genes